MGCDIHCVTQARKGEKWETIAEGYGERNYPAFAIMADVRNHDSGFIPIDEPRDFPEDFSEDPEMERFHLFPAGVDHRYSKYASAGEDPRSFWMGDHSFSWLLARELCDPTWRGFMADGQTYEQAVGVHFIKWLAQLEVLMSEFGRDNVRVVFGFDS